MRHDLTSPDSRFYTLIGYPRDLMVFTLGARFFRNDNLSISGLLSVQLQGEHGSTGSIEYDYEWTEAAFDKRNPSGVAEQNYTFSVAAQKKFASFIAVGGRLSGIISRNNGHDPDVVKTGMQAAVSVTFSY
jgi:hypothetical protein